MRKRGPTKAESFASTPVFVVTRAQALAVRRRTDFFPVEAYPPDIIPLRTEIGFVRDSRLVLALPKWVPPEGSHALGLCPEVHCARAIAAEKESP